jgi:hypothetical protein
LSALELSDLNKLQKRQHMILSTFKNKAKDNSNYLILDSRISNELQAKNHEIELEKKRNQEVLEATLREEGKIKDFYDKTLLNNGNWKPNFQISLAHIKSVLMYASSNFSHKSNVIERDPNVNPYQKIDLQSKAAAELEKFKSAINSFLVYNKLVLPFVFQEVGQKSTMTEIGINTYAAKLRRYFLINRSQDFSVDYYKKLLREENPVVALMAFSVPPEDDASWFVTKPLMLDVTNSMEIRNAYDSELKKYNYGTVFYVKGPIKTWEVTDNRIGTDAEGNMLYAKKVTLIFDRANITLTAKP